MKANGEVKVKLHRFLFLALDGGERSPPCHRFIPLEKALVASELEARWIPEPLNTLWRRIQSIPPARNQITIP
jgi:hypothetical protein